MKHFNTLLIGLGNEFRHDDGAGIFIVRELKKQNLLNTHFTEHHGEGVDLIEEWKSFKRVLVFDAVSSGGIPGTIHKFNIPHDVIPNDIIGSSTHTFSIAETVKLARALDQLPEKLTIYGIEGEVFEVGEGLSSVVEQTCRKIILEIIR